MNFLISYCTISFNSFCFIQEQEMKSTYSKLQVLKSQLQDKKGINTDVSVNSNFDDFLKR